MINIITALYCEAQPLILHYQLKKDSTIHQFQLFQNDEIRLILTNTGSISAAVGVTYLHTLYPPSASDILINIGVCAAMQQELTEGRLFLCNKITEQFTNRCFYPDILFKHPFEEGEVVTCSSVMREADILTKTGLQQKLFDMEAAGIYQAAAYFYQPHQIYFLKIISDHGQGGKLSTDKVTGLIQRNMNQITSWLQRLNQVQIAEKEIFTEEEEACVKELSEKLLCSVTMEFKLRQLLQHYKLTQGSFLELVKEFSIEAGLPCTMKSKGKIYFEQLKARLL